MRGDADKPGRTGLGAARSGPPGLPLGLCELSLSDLLHDVPVPEQGLEPERLGEGRQS